MESIDEAQGYMDMPLIDTQPIKCMVELPTEQSTELPTDMLAVSRATDRHADRAVSRVANGHAD